VHEDLQRTEGMGGKPKRTREIDKTLMELRLYRCQRGSNVELSLQHGICHRLLRNTIARS
jgi:hypothetical protein